MHPGRAGVLPAIPGGDGGSVTSHMAIDGGGTIDGLPMNREPVQLKLEGVKAYEDGAVWLRYQVK